MALFKEKKTNKPKIEITSAPEEPESVEELRYMEGISDKEITKNFQNQAMIKEIKEEYNNENEKYQQIPVCMSQTQINNIVIENNTMLKWIVSKIEEEGD